MAVSYRRSFIKIEKTEAVLNQAYVHPYRPINRPKISCDSPFKVRGEGSSGSWLVHTILLYTSGQKINDDIYIPFYVDTFYLVLTIESNTQAWIC
jgi:hypothetical protein